MVPIHTKPPNREYDEGWDRIFKKKEPDLAPAPQLPGTLLPEPGPETTEHTDLAPAKRMPRGWTPKK